MQVDQPDTPLSEQEACRMMREALGFPLTPLGEECLAGCMGVIFRRLSARSERAPMQRWSIHAKADGGYLRKDDNGDLVLYADISPTPNTTDAMDAARYRAWRDGDVIVRRSPESGWEARHRDTPHWDVGSWRWNESLDAAIDDAMKDGGPL